MSMAVRVCGQIGVGSSRDEQVSMPISTLILQSSILTRHLTHEFDPHINFLGVADLEPGRDVWRHNAGLLLRGVLVGVHHGAGRHPPAVPRPPRVGGGEGALPGGQLRAQRAAGRRLLVSSSWLCVRNSGKHVGCCSCCCFAGEVGVLGITTVSDHLAYLGSDVCVKGTLPSELRHKDLSISRMHDSQLCTCSQL